MAAEPMFDAFTNQPDFAPYMHLPNEISLSETNPTVAQATRAVQAAWAQWSAKQDWASEDMLNMAQGNRDVWYASNNFTKPYPGDTKVLLPDQVPGANSKPVTDDDDGH
jgi:hypothetical protein